MARYCFDTSSFLEPWVRRLPPDVFPAFWEGLSELIRNGEIVSPVEVLHETAKQKDDLHDWLLDRSSVFLELDEAQQRAVREILGEFRGLVKEHKRSSAADPFVIALARTQALTIVTEEGAGSVGKPTIPFVSDRYGIKHMNIVEFMREQKWQFRGR